MAFVEIYLWLVACLWEEVRYFTSEFDRGRIFQLQFQGRYIAAESHWGSRMLPSNVPHIRQQPSSPTLLPFKSVRFWGGRGGHSTFPDEAQ